jgi:hypothetical protein
MYYEITKYSYSGGKNKNFDGTFILQKKSTFVYIRS